MADPVDNVLRQFNAQQQNEAATDDAAGRVLGRFKMQEDGISENDFAAMMVGQTKLGSPDSPIGTRALLSVFGDTFDEQQAAFEMIRPEGDIRLIEPGGVVVYRNSADEQFRKLDPGFFESLGLGLSGAGKEFIADLADFSGEVPEIAGEIASMFARRPGVGGKLVSDLTRLTVGGSVGEMLQQSAQDVAGTQRQTSEEAFRQVMGSGAESLLGGAAGAAVGGAVNVFRGRGIGGVAEGGQEAIAAAQRLGTLPPLPSQVSQIPIIQKLGRQSQALVSTINRYLMEQEQRTAAAVRALIDDSKVSQFITNTGRAFAASADEIVSLAQSVTRGTTDRAAGRALQQGIEAWWRTAGEDVDRLYAVARGIEPPEFNLGDLLTTAAGIEAGIPGVDQAGTTFRLSDLSPDLQAIVQDIRRLDPSLPPVTLPDGTVVDGVAQLRALQSRVRDLTLAGPEGPRQAQFVARDLAEAIRRTLETPVNDSPEFVKAWEAANGAARKRFDTREQLAVVGAANSETPSTLARGLAQPGQLDNLVALRSAVTDDKWGQFQDFFKVQLLDDPFQMATRLDSFDEPTLNLLMSKGDQRIFRETAASFARLGETGLIEALQTQTRVQPFMQLLFRSSDTVAIDALREFAFQGGRDTLLARSFQSAIIDDIFKRSMIVEKGRQVLDFNRLTSTLDELEGRGVMDFLDPGQVQVLRDAQLMQDFARLGSDAGTSLQAASAVADIRSGGLSGLWTLFENISTARIITSAAGQRILMGRGLGAADTRTFKLLGSIAETLRSDAEQSQATGAAIDRQIEGLLSLLAPSLRQVEISERLMTPPNEGP